jgi:predicted nucleotide-binding protein
MDRSTFSIVVLTGDGYCKPNVFIELGYLLHKNKWRRTFIVAERGIELPTDIADNVCLDFDKTAPLKDEMERIYLKLLDSMAKAKIITTQTLETLRRRGP